MTTPTQILALRQLPVREMLSHLEVLFPNRLPDTLTDPREVDAKVGEQRVLTFLRRIAVEAESSTDVLTPTVP